ncbi:MAG: hypothetical protein OHK0039_21860 [Bacteroidia bacterium]
MQELYQLAIAPPTLPYTIMLGLVLLYWLTVFIGALDLNFLDFSLDKDVDLSVDKDIDLGIDKDVDLSVDKDIDLDKGVEVEGDGWMSSVLSFFNLGQVPFMIFLSLLVLVMWVGSIVAHRLLGGNLDWFFLLWLIPNLILGLFLTKLLSTPFKGLHKHLTASGTQKRELVGKIGVVTIDIRPQKMGRIELVVDEQSFALDVLSHATETIPSGAQALIVEYDAAEDTFWVEPFEV